jgi:GMP reductase
MDSKIALNYSDVYLVPEYSELESRKLANTEIQLGKNTFNLPIVPSNMKTVIDEKWSKWLSDNDYFYIMHRFDAVTVPFVKHANENNFKFISISTGVNQDSLDELLEIKANTWNVDYITIDVAHGHHKKVKTRIEEIKKLFPEVFVIAGNVTTADGIKDLEDWGADATRVGIGPGRACTTRFQTGFHVPMFTALQECASVANTPIFADGGINHYGDVAKALVAGASWIMAGSLFAACSDSPALVMNGKKVYYGSASAHNKGHNNHIEGTILDLELHSSLSERLIEIQQALQSSISYSGGNNLNSLKTTKYVIKNR